MFVFGRDVTIMSGVDVGDGAVIAANSHVVKDVPPYAIVGGNPASVINYRFEESVIEHLFELEWWSWPEDIIFQSAPFLCNKPDFDFLAFGEGSDAQ